MPTALLCAAERRRRAWAILAGYNLPFALWSGYALYRVFAPGAALGCPVRAVLGWCPSCGLTGEYATILSGHAPKHALIWVVLAGFAVNALVSVLKVRRLRAAERAPIAGAADQPLSDGHRTPA
jgi:hypothetical protein